ncbi:MAG: DUF424 domain-containing protein [Candidatus Hydrothermarchaeota archaeon]
MRVKGETIVAICDEDILGKKFSEGELKLWVNPEFYGKKLVSAKEAIETLSNASIGNIVGKNIVRHAISAGLVLPENVIEVEGVPHAQILWL